MIYSIARHLLHDAENVNAYGLFSLVVFFAFFTGVIFWASRLKKNYLNHMGALPLDGGESPKSSTDKLNS